MTTNMASSQQPTISTALLLPQNASTNIADKITAIANRTALPVTSPDDKPSTDFCLYFNENRLTLRDQTTTNPVDVCVDYCAGKNRHRVQFGGGLGQPLARAINAKALRSATEHQPMICDATGGFGRDALVFATLGCRVVILEQSAIIYELLKDGIGRAQTDDTFSETANRMEVHLADSTQLPKVWPHQVAPHTVYLDPMYPRTDKTAAAKKEMQTLKKLFADSDNNADADRALLTAALHTATNRVVVKRPKSAQPVEGATPVGNISSINTRYDLYKPG